MIRLKMILAMTMMKQFMHTEMSGVSEKAVWTMLTLGKRRPQVHTMPGIWYNNDGCDDDEKDTPMKAEKDNAYPR